MSNRHARNVLDWGLQTYARCEYCGQWTNNPKCQCCGAPVEMDDDRLPRPRGRMDDPYYIEDGIRSYVQPERVYSDRWFR